MAGERRYIEELHAAIGASAGGADLLECLDRSALGVYLVDRGCAIVWLNPAMSALLGRAVDDCLGRPVAELHDDPHVLEDMFLRLRAGERVASRPVRLRTAAGVRELTLSASPGLDHDGALIGARFCVRDPERAASRESAAAIIEQAPLGIVRVQADATILAANPALCHLYGRDGLVGCDLFALTHPDDRQLDRDKFDQLRAGHIAHYSLTRRIVRDDATSVWTQLHACAVRDARGGTGFYLGFVEDIDVRHRAEDQRRRAARQFEALARLSPVGIFLGDDLGQCVYVNDEWTRITGRTLPEARGHGWRRAIHPDDLERVTAGHRAALADHTPYRGEWRMLRPDGAVVSVLGQFAEFTDGDDHAIQLGTITDISARVRAELDRAMLADIVEGAADALLLLHADGTVAIWNTGAEKLLGYTSAEIEGRHIRALVPGHAPEVADGLRRVLAGAVVRHTDARIQRKDGGSAVVDITACPVRDAGGDITKISVIFHDVSDLKRTEQALRLSEERFRSLVEAIAQIVWSTDADGQIVEDSPSWRAFTGQTFEEMRGWGWTAAIAPDQQARIITRWKHAVAARKPVTAEYKVRRSDGSYADSLVRAVPLLSPDGSVREWVGVSVDITEQRRSEQQREALVADLRRAMHYQDMFFAVLSHDLRSPLSAVLMATGLGLRRCNDDRLRRILQQIASSGQRMLRMIEQLLDVTRIRAAGGLEIRPTRADLAALCRTIIDELQQAHPDARVVLDAHGDTEGTWDVDRLSQVASNLIGNAIQHAAGPRVSTVLVDGRDPATVDFVVHNRGVIAAELLGTIFDPFHRTEKGSGTAAGLGLGLYITEQIALAHGGAVTVESTAAGGTYFRVRLPRHPRSTKLTPADPGDDHPSGAAAR